MLGVHQPIKTMTMTSTSSSSQIISRSAKAHWVSAPQSHQATTEAYKSRSLGMQLEHNLRRHHEMIQLSVLFLAVIGTCIAIVVG